LLVKDFLNIEDFKFIMDPKFIRVLSFTFYEAILSAAFALIVSLIPAIYVYRKRNTLSSLLENSIFIPFFFPPVSMVIAFSIIFASNGVLSKFGINLNIMYSIKAIVVAHVFYNSPIFVKYIGSALKLTDPMIEEASKIDGAGKFTRFFKVEFPQVLPAVMKSFFLVFTYSFMSFAVVLNLGGVKYSTIEVSIANALRGNFDFSKALTYAAVQFGILFVVNYVLSKIGSKVYETGYPVNSREKAGIITTSLSVIYAIFEYGIVVIGLSGIFYDFYNDRFSLKHFFNLFSEQLNRRFPVVISMVNSAMVAFITGIVAVIFSYLFLKIRSKITDSIILPILGISSAFLATSLLYLNIVLAIPFFILILIGYILISTPLAYSFLYQGVKGFPDDIVEAAKLDGAGKLKIFSKIEFPILLPNFMAVFFQIFAIIYGEFTISYTMQIRDFFPLASVVNYSLSAQRYYLESSAFSSFNIIVIFLLFFISTKIISSKKY